MGNFWDLGNFDECIGIENVVSATHRVAGKYCLANFRLSSRLVLKTGVCFPASCSASQLDAILRKLFQALLGEEIGQDVEIVSEDTCKTAETEPYDGLTIFTMYVSVLKYLGGDKFGSFQSSFIDTGLFGGFKHAL